MNTTNAKLRIQTALLELMGEKEFDKISIMDIIRRAGVSRTTYYYHYYEQHEIIEDILDSFFVEMRQIFNTTDADFHSIVRSLFLNGLHIVYSNQDMLKVVFSSSIEDEFKAKFISTWQSASVSWMKRYPPSDNLKSYLPDYMFWGIYNTYKNWVLNGCTDSIDHIADFLAECAIRFADGKN